MDPVQEIKMRADLVSEFSAELEQLKTKYPEIEQDEKISIDSGAYMLNGLVLSYITDRTSLDVIICHDGQVHSSRPESTYLAEVTPNFKGWRRVSQRIIGLDNNETYSSQELAKHCMEKLLRAAQQEKQSTARHF